MWREFQFQPLDSIRFLKVTISYFMTMTSTRIYDLVRHTIHVKESVISSLVDNW